MMEEKIYLCIDLKSFYASVECVERGLDPFEINLVVADPDRGDGAITLAATPAIKKLGVPSRGTCKITNRTNSYRILMEEFHLLYKRIVDPNYPIRQIALSFGNVRDEIYEQYDLFADMEKIEKERKLQQTLVNIRNKYGKNAVLKGMNYLPKGTARYRNMTIGGHKA